MPDEEQKGVIGNEVLFSEHGESHDAGGGRCCLCALLIHLDEGLVDNGREEEAAVPIHPRKIGLCCIEHVRHAQRGQGGLQLVVIFQLELGQVDADVCPSVHVVSSCPFLYLLQRQLILQL